MAPLTPKRRRAIALGGGIVLALALVGLVARSPGARASISAAYRAFRDPTLVTTGAADRGSEALPPAALELEQPDISGDFDTFKIEDMADAGEGTVGSLTWPDIPIPISNRTMRFVAYFAENEKGRQTFLDSYRRGGRYRPVIERALRDADLPEDLLWLVAIESGFNPQATSPKGAVGLFQFMPQTGARYGLAQSDEIDERRSITKASAQAVAYLRDLFARFGSWDLALAAYNFGEDNLDQAIEKLKAKRGPRDANKPVEFKDLAEARLLPKETANYVPLIQAFAIVAANRGRFKLDQLDAAEPFEIGEIAVPPGTEVRTIAKAAGISLELFRDYNPDLLRPSVPKSGGDVLVNIPASSVARALAALPVLLPPSESASAATEASAQAAPTASANAAAAASASASRTEKSAPSAASEKLTLANGVNVVCEGPPAGEVVIGATVELLAPTRTGVQASGPSKSINSVRVPAAEIERGLTRAAGSLRALIDGDAGAELRRLVAAGRRADVSRAPYGSSWIALSDRLFPAGHPLAGTTLTGPLMPLISVVFTEPPPRGAMRVTVHVNGAAQSAVATPSARAFGGVFDPGPVAPPHPREDRVPVTEKVQSPRIVFGWISPPGDDASNPALRLGMLLLAHDRFGKVARALVGEKRVAVHVRGSIEHFARGSVAAIEATPAIKYDVATVEQELDRALTAFIEQGPSALELTEAKDQLRARLVADRGRAGTTGEPKDIALARIGKLLTGGDAATSDEVQGVVKRVFSKEHRVIVITTPGP